MNDSRLWHIRRLVSEAGSIAAELRGEFDTATTEGIYLEMLCTYLSWAIGRTKALEEL